jgi:hypothetical protein
MRQIVDTKKRSKDVGGDRSCMQSPHEFLIKSDTEVFHRMRKRDVPSFQWEMSLDWSTTMREIDGLRIILIDFYVPALTPPLHCEAALQLSENTISLRTVAYIRVSSAKRAVWSPGVSWVSFIYSSYRIGDRTGPCGTPARISRGTDILLST